MNPGMMSHEAQLIKKRLIRSGAAGFQKKLQSQKKKTRQHANLQVQP